MIDTAKLRADAEKATPGPWHLASDNTIIQTSHVTRDVWFIPKIEADLVYIAAANPQTIIALLDEVERLRAENENLRNQKP